MVIVSFSYTSFIFTALVLMGGLSLLGLLVEALRVLIESSGWKALCHFILFLVKLFTL